MTLIRSISVCPPKHTGTEWPWSGASQCVLQNMQAQNDPDQEHLDVSSKTCRHRMTLIRSISLCPPKHTGTEWPWSGASQCVLQNMQAQNDTDQEHLDVSSKTCRNRTTLIRNISTCPPKHAGTEWPWSGASRCVLQNMQAQNDPDLEHLDVSSKTCRHRMNQIRNISVCPPKHAGTEWPWSGASGCVLQNMQAQNGFDQEHLDVSSKTCRHRMAFIRSISMCPAKHAGAEWPWSGASQCVLQNMQAHNDTDQEHLSDLGLHCLPRPVLIGRFIRLISWSFGLMPAGFLYWSPWRMYVIDQVCVCNKHLKICYWDILLSMIENNGTVYSLSVRNLCLVHSI